MIVIPALLLLVPRYELNGAAISMLAATIAVGLTKLWLSLRAVELPAGSLLRALAPAVLCSAALGASLAILQVPAEELSPLLALLLVVAGGLSVYVTSTALFARSIVVPAWSSLRGSR